jgi:hypothetical protein
MAESDRMLSQVSRAYTHEGFANQLTNIIYTSSDIYRVKEAFNKSQNVREVLSKTRHSVITPEHISRMWDIGLDKAKETKSHDATGHSLCGASDPPTVQGLPSPSE